MTGEYGCLGCEGKNPVNWLITRLNPGSTTSVCDQDIDAALLAMLATRLEVDAGWLSETIDAALDKLQQLDGPPQNEVADAVADADADPDPSQQELDAQPDDDDGTPPGFPEGYNEPDPVVPRE